MSPEAQLKPAIHPAAHDRPVPAVGPAHGSRAWNLGKRAFDLVLASLLLLVLAPALALVALLIKLDSPGPVLFRQRRLGLSMDEFTVFKFRTMRPGVSAKAHQEYIARLANGNGTGNGHHANGNGNGNGRMNGNGHASGNGNGELKKLTADPRVTRVGAVLRRLSIDELPQLLNVIGGSMSLIGPRPALDYEPQHYAPRHFERFRVRPGLSGLWQVSGRNRLGFIEMLDLDADYAESYGPVTDAKILLRTPVAMVRDCA